MYEEPKIRRNATSLKGILKNEYRDHVLEEQEIVNEKDAKDEESNDDTQSGKMKKTKHLSSKIINEKLDFDDNKEERNKDSGNQKLQNFLNLKEYDIFSFARHNKYEYLETLFMAGINPNSKDAHGNSVLIVAAQNNNKRICKIALKYMKL